MRSAARHREPAEEPPPDDAAAVIAELRRIGGKTDEIIARMRTIDGDRELVIESISLAAHWAEARERLEALDARLPTLAQAHRMGMGDERRRAEREAAERAAAEQPRPRHRHRKPHLTVLAGSVAAASVVAASAGVTIAAQDSASVHPAAAAASHAAFRRMPPDSAAPVPSWSPSAKPSAAVRAATPAPTVTAVPASSSPPAPPPPAPPPPVTVPAGPVLVAPRLLDLAGSHFGHLPLTVTGPGEVTWTATATDGIRLEQSAGVVVSGQTVEIQVTDPTGGGGWIYVSFGGTTIPVQVTSSDGTPAVALP